MRTLSVVTKCSACGLTHFKVDLFAHYRRKVKLEWYFICPTNGRTVIVK